MLSAFSAGAKLPRAIGEITGADTLREALAKAYASNPTLTGARAQLRATDESVPTTVDCDTFSGTLTPDNSRSDGA